MPHVEKIEDKDGHGHPLRITHRKGGQERRRQVAPSLRIRCGCCEEALVIFPPQHTRDTIEIAGVMGTRDQWRKILGPMLGMVPGDEVVETNEEHLP